MLMKAFELLFFAARRPEEESKEIKIYFQFNIVFTIQDKNL